MVSKRPVLINRIVLLALAAAMFAGGDRAALGGAGFVIIRMRDYLPSS